MNILGWAAALLALTLSCSKTPDIQDPEAGLPPFPKAEHEIDRVPLTRAEEAFVLAGNQFAWKLTKKVWDEGEKKSLILSPLSVQYALGMLGNGADAETSAPATKGRTPSTSSAPSSSRRCRRWTPASPWPSRTGCWSMTSTP